MVHSIGDCFKHGILLSESAQQISEVADGIVIGGGGLLLRDQAGSDISKSGWQWNSSVDAVNGINIPLIIFAIGYNRFRGQADFDPVFTSHIRALASNRNFQLAQQRLYTGTQAISDA